MRITRRRLTRIINEEMRRVIREQTVTQGPISIDGEEIPGSEDPGWWDLTPEERGDDVSYEFEEEIIGTPPRHDEDAMLTSFMVDVDFDYQEGTDSEYAQMMQSLGDMWLTHFRSVQSPGALEEIGANAVAAAETVGERYPWESDTGWSSDELRAEMVDVTNDALTVALSEPRPGMSQP